MNLLFYATINKTNTRKAFGIMQHLKEDAGIEFYRDIRLLMQRLRQPPQEFAAVTLFASSMEELDELFMVRHFLEDIPLILVLQKNNREAIRKGHLLRPRFLSLAESDQREIGAVLNNMLQKAKTYPMHREISE